MPVRMPDQESQPQGGASELASFGEELRREREIRGISLKEISDATKISKRFLEAIERNDHHTLPAPVFTRGFVREYARYLGLSAEDMVNRYNYAAANDDRIEKPPQIRIHPPVPVKDISPKPPPKKGIPPAFARIDRNFIFLLFIAAALAAVAWWAIRNKGFDFDSDGATDTSTAIPIATRPVTQPPPEPRPAVPDDSVLRMNVEVLGDSWVVLEADGKIVFQESMKAGQRRDFEANEQFRFRTIGNGAGLKLTINGLALPLLGDEGEVIKNRVFDRQTVADLRRETPSSQP
jgi:hypothetical protein